MDAPKRIWVEDEFGDDDDDQWQYGTWDCSRHRGYQTEYILASEHANIVAEKDARIAVMRKALMAFEQHEASHFRGPDAEKNRRQSYRGVKRAVRAALKGDSDE